MLIEDNQRFNYTPSLNNKSRVIAENQFQQIQEELEKHNVKADYSDLLIKKGEIYKEHIGATRS